MVEASQDNSKEKLKSGSLKHTFSAFKNDIDRYGTRKSFVSYLSLIGVKGLWVTAQYRHSRWVHFCCHWPIARQLSKLFCFISQKLVEVLTGAEIPNRADIGSGFFMPHTNGIVIHIDAVIGKNCNIGQQVTIGLGGRGDHAGTPVIGDSVFIGPGAKIFGPITIGNNVAIGANAVVTKDLPDNAVAVGIPAKIISFRGAQDFVK